MSVVTLSGWGQPYDALENIAQSALHIPYSQYNNVGEALADIAVKAADAKTVIGWSLGAQLAVRSVALGHIKPQCLVLIAPAFQFVEKPGLPLGMKQDLHDKFHTNYVRNPERTLHKAWELIIKDDAQENTIRGYIEKQNKTSVIENHWQFWLEELERFSCDDLPFDDFPPTMLVHGEKDVVIDIAQSRHFVSKLPSAELITLPDCGHAPHWHNEDALKLLVRRRAHV
jgi:pimeloyl-[acyl-carrier protein] methyl ester esterase